MTNAHSVIRLIAIIVLITTGAATAVSQTSQELREFLRRQAAFSEDDFSALQQGQVVVKLQPVKDKREVAVWGVLRIKANADLLLKAFQASMKQKNDKAVLEVGKFSTRPVLADLQKLNLEARDIRDLRQCVVGKCELKLSAAMIERFQKEIKWNEPNNHDQANRLFRQLLLNYVRDYLARGDAALIEYHDQLRAVSVREEQQALLDRALCLNDFAPEFSSYLKGFPKSKLANVENSVSWTKLRFGLKPVIVITHVSTYFPPRNNAQQIISIAKQIYADHYFDSSLAVTAVIGNTAGEGVTESYLLYTNHSRADSMAGALSRLKRRLVESEAVENLKDLLQQTRDNVEVIQANQPASAVPSGKEKFLDWLSGSTQVFWWVTGLVMLLIFVWAGQYHRLRLRR